MANPQRAMILSAMNQSNDIPWKNCRGSWPRYQDLSQAPFVARLITTWRTVAQQFTAKMAGNVDDREKEGQMTLEGTTKVFS